MTGFRDPDFRLRAPSASGMLPEMPISGYGFSCERCHLYVRLADLLPRREDVVSLVAKGPTATR